MGRKPKPDPIAVLSAAAKTRRSTLYGWMQQNYAEFERVVQEAVRPNWDALSKAFTDQGLRDAGGQPPSSEVTRLTWIRVRKAMKAREASRAKGSPARPVRPAQTPVVRTVAPPTPKPSKDDDFAALRAGLASSSRKPPEPL
jgi:hypothetical protein